ncbi:MAG: penicillin acylase family protein [Phaeodactylibacter sp.]|nr:penicillin acylase family protein [Phaeodactylibacter sp.]MCB9300249.1 penicillin acylase family protein [Lewinellaceae bacterium]
MRILKFAIVALITGALTQLASQHQPLGTALPALGPLLSPFTGFWQNAEPMASPPDGVLASPHLKGKVDVVFDQRLVPHIFAESLEDAAFVQGYLAAKYRLWQMDIAIRATAGRLAEVAGERALERDRLQRRKGMLWAAENALKGWQRNPQEYALIEAYTQGANTFIDALRPADYPLEFKLMGYQPEPWSPLKSAIFFKSMAETLSSRYEDLSATNSRLVLGDSLFQFLFPEYNPRQSPVIPADVQWAFAPAPLQHQATDAPEMIGQLIPHRQLAQPDDGLGSNNWAVAGSKTATGRPMLCNDPHLRLSLPSIWYEIQIHTPEVNAYGASFPGVPGILIGFNDNTAWGVTNGSHDVLDWYRIDWTDEQRESYYYNGAPRPVDKLVEVIKVRGRAEPLLDTVRYTVWGPVVYEDPAAPYFDMAMRWVAHDLPEEKPFTEVGTFWKLMQSKNYDDYWAAMRGFDNPAQNFVFAQKDGDIAITVDGKLPLKRPEQGRFVQEGSSAANAWYGFIPRDQVPTVRNPERGFVSSANQHSTGPSYPYYYNGYFDDYRGRLINRRLEAMKDITVQDMMALQLEDYSLKAEEALPLLFALLDSSATALGARPEVKALRDWDYHYAGDAQAPVLFELWLEEAHQSTFDELLAMKDSLDVLLPETWRFLELLSQYPHHAVFDLQGTPKVEQASDIVTRALESALSQVDGESWASHKDTHINHLANIPAFSHQHLSVGGWRDAPNAISEQNGPSWRMVVALGDEVEAYGIYPGGQSGNPGSAYYDNMIDDWVAGEYYKLYFMKGPADRREAAIFTLSFESRK